MDGADGPRWTAPSGTATLVLDPSGRRVAAGIRRGPLAPPSDWRLFDAATGAQIGPPVTGVVRARFSSDGRFLAAGAQDGRRIRLLDAESGEAVGRPLEQPTAAAALRDASFSPTGRKVIVASSGVGVFVWDASLLYESGALGLGTLRERAQLAPMRTIDEEGVEREIPLAEWQRRRDRWRREHGE